MTKRIEEDPKVLAESLKLLNKMIGDKSLTSIQRADVLLSVLIAIAAVDVRWSFEQFKEWVLKSAEVSYRESMAGALARLDELTRDPRQPS